MGSVPVGNGGLSPRAQKLGKPPGLHNSWGESYASLGFYGTTLLPACSRIVETHSLRNPRGEKTKVLIE